MKLSSKIVFLMLTSQLSFGSVFSVFKSAGHGLDELLVKSGIADQEVRSVVANNIELAMKDLSHTGKKEDFSMNTLKMMVSGSQDKARFQKVEEVFSKESATPEEIKNAINNFVYLSQRYGYNKSGILSCAPCVNKNLSDAGFNFVLSEMKDDYSQRIFKVMSRYSSPVKLSRQINSAVKSQKWSSRTPMLNATDEEALLYFLTAEKVGSPVQKDLIAAIRDVSVSGGKVDLFSNTNGHKFYSFLSSGFSDAEMTELTRLLKATSDEMKDTKKGTMDAFFDVLQREADEARTPATRQKKLALLEYLRDPDTKCFSK
ncbi:hypothetical protein ACRXCV_04060 [Halobacteriovorax sp. GFR7]|uniref:hypothetical protein n=1 Tax=unclassified Halobacteriovorax TaxID=2639665 RepID=UPI00371CABD1